MLPRAEGQQSNNNRGGRRGGATNRLRPEDLTRQPKEARIVNVKADPDSQYGAQVICKLAVDGQTKFWYISVKKNPNYAVLTNQFGHDENDWIDKRILLHTEEDDFYGNPQIRVGFAEKETTRGRK